jgi:hypothetical protein
LPSRISAKPLTVSSIETEHAGDVGEDLGHVEGLGEETLDLAGAEDGHLVLVGQLVHAENGDDVLQVLVALEHLLDAAGDAVVFLADDFRGERLGGGGERIDGGEERLLGERTLEHDGGVEVGEGVGGRRVGQGRPRARKRPGSR